MCFQPTQNYDTKSDFRRKRQNLIVRVELVLCLDLRLELLVGGLQLGVVPVDRLDLVVRQVMVS